MPPIDNLITRRDFSKSTVLASSALVLGNTIVAVSQDAKPKRIRTAVIGCGSVSRMYLPDLMRSPFVEVVSVCDIRPERAQRQGDHFKIAKRYPNLEAQIAGEPFEFLVNLTDMQEHEHLNRTAIEAGKHVWSEKPIANSLDAGRQLLKLSIEKRVRLWGAPIPVQSPQFAFMARTLAGGKLGRIAAAHAEYGHEGPHWSSFFYEKNGGSMPDLAVYNLTTITGLLGPAKRVTAMLSTVTPERKIEGKGNIKVSEEDNASILIDHGSGIISHTQSGFNYFNPNGHDGSLENRHTVSIIGNNGFLGMVGYDWKPLGVDLGTCENPTLKRFATDADGYVWEQGASLAAQSLANGKELLATPEHALHVLEIICSARESQSSGRRIELQSTFKWPVVS